jgi:L-lactate dehydrogenase complex protein LldG
MTTRAEFLARIRGEMGRAVGAPLGEISVRPARPRERLDLLRRELAERWRDTLARFTREFERVGGVFHRVDDAAAVVPAIARLAEERGMRRAVSWHAATLGLEIAAPPAEVEGAERARLRAIAAAADFGVTGVDLAIAETGTMVVISGAGRPRAASLLPGCHVAVFDRDVLVESLAQAGLALEAWHDGPAPADRGASINFVTGPSRTADIELTLTRGVHGPRDVHAIFVEQGLGPRRG